MAAGYVAAKFHSSMSIGGRVIDVCAQAMMDLVEIFKGMYDLAQPKDFAGDPVQHLDPG